MKDIIVVVVLLLLAGPLRKWMLAHWTLVVGLAIGSVVGFYISAMMVRLSGPAWLLIAGPVMGAAVVGVEIKKFLDSIC